MANQPRSIPSVWECSDIQTDNGKITVFVRANITVPKKRLINNIAQRKRVLPLNKPTLSFYIRISHNEEKDDDFQVVVGLTAMPQQAIAKWLQDKGLGNYVEQTISSIKALLECLGEKIFKERKGQQ